MESVYISNVDIPVKLIRIEKQKLILLSQFEEHSLSFFPEYPLTPSKVLDRLARHPVCPWPPQVKNCISVLGRIMSESFEFTTGL